MPITHTVDPTKSDWVDYAVQAYCKAIVETGSHATRIGILVHSPLSSLSHRDPGLKSGTGALKSLCIRSDPIRKQLFKPYVLGIPTWVKADHKAHVAAYNVQAIAA